VASYLFRDTRINSELSVNSVKKALESAGLDPKHFNLETRPDRSILVSNQALHLPAIEEALKSVSPSVSITPYQAGLTATQYQVHITMNGPTVASLTAGNFNLYAFKAIKTPGAGGQPTVWFQTKNIALNTNVKWQEQYSAYTSVTEIRNGATIEASNSYPIDLGQKLVVNNPAGIGFVAAGTEGHIVINNQQAKTFTCGISQSSDVDSKDPVFTPLCAFPLYGQQADSFTPVQKVLLLFSTDKVDTGTVIEQAFSESLLVDVTGETLRQVSYDINDGWTWNQDASWAKKYPVEQSLSSLLILG
jgi:hypothetical protein